MDVEALIEDLRHEAAIARDRFKIDYPALPAHSYFWVGEQSAYLHAAWLLERELEKVS